MKIKVAIYDDNEDLRLSLNNLINSTEELELVGSYPDCSKVEWNIQKDKAEVVLMDIDMPGRSGIEGTKLIKTQNPKCEVLIHTVFADNSSIFEALKNGASGYLLKNSANELIISAIKEVVFGGAPMSPSIARKLVEHHKHLKPNPYRELLSKRELEIVEELSKGNSYKMVGQKLSISVETVKSHCKHVYEKLHVNNIGGALHKLNN